MALPVSKQMVAKNKRTNFVFLVLSTTHLPKHQDKNMATNSPKPNVIMEDPNADEVEHQLKDFMKQLSSQAKQQRVTSIKQQAEACKVIGIDLGTTTSCAAVWYIFFYFKFFCAGKTMKSR